MKDAKGKYLYIGKAKNLRARLRQYFSYGDERAMIPFLVSKVDTIETIVVSNEKEALLVENNLIKQHKPPYNVHLKDDKSYLALQVNIQHDWPKVSLVRVKGKPKGKDLFLGPFTSAFAAKETLDEVHKLFMLRQCSDEELKRRDRPCLLYQIKRCMAPCVSFCTKEAYDHELQRALKFLKGESQEVIELLKKKMTFYSEQLEYEKAQKCLDKIKQFERTLEKQRVNQIQGKDFEVWGMYREADRGVLTLLFYKEGKLLGVKHFPFTKNAQENVDLLETALLQYYEGKGVKEVLVPAPLSKELLDTLPCRVLFPQKGDKEKLVRLACENAQAYYNEQREKGKLVEQALMEMQELFNLKKYPYTIDCVDISHFSGKDPVAVVVTFENGVKKTARFRTYRVAKGDDYRAMEEVLRRRYKKAKEEDQLPDLLIVDGGKGQLNVAAKVLEEQLIGSLVDVLGLAKESARHDKGLTQEKVFLPGKKEAILLPKHSPLLFLMQRIRDEAHRFAIAFQTKSRSKKIRKSVLDGVPGIGPKRKRALLTHFGSVKKIKEATEEQLLPFLPKKVIEILKRTLSSC